MPPRRSTRSSARQSVEPENDHKPGPSSKRKRSSEETNDIDPQEDPASGKPPSRTTRRPSSKAAPPASVSRASSRSKSVSHQVRNLDDENDDGKRSHSRKRPRPSQELEDVHEEDEEEDTKPIIGHRTRESSRLASSSTSRKVGNEQAVPAEVEPEDNSSKPSTSRRGGRPSTSRAVRVKAEPLDDPTPENTDSVDNGDAKLSEAFHRKVAKRSSRKRESTTLQLVENDDSGDDTNAGENATAVVLNGCDAPDFLAEESTPVPSPKKLPSTMPLVHEEEKSLLDDLPTSPSKTRRAPPPPEESQGPRPRLVIQKLVLVNFKSYAGRQEIGPFHKSFSAIVGPNGSGKSNTIDALLFVFGYRASKMRQGKLSELIHNSAQHPDLQECSVEVHFREIIDLPGPDAYTVIPDSTLSVARIAYKNNSSKYTINGRASNYKEVQTLLKGRGIDLDHNRFLILQGEVESIAQMKPKAPSEHEDGLLEYLEDIIGTSQYKGPIDESLLEMERLTEDRAEKLNRLRLVERERNALEKEKREAENYLRLQNDHVRAQSTLYQYYIWRCLVSEKEVKQEIARIEKELAEERERNKDDIMHLESLEGHYAERVQAYEEVKAAAAEALKEMAVYEKQEVGLEEKRKHANGKAKKLKKSLQDDKNARDNALRAVEENVARMKNEKTKADQLEEDLQNEEKVLEGIRDSLKGKTQVFHDQIEQKQKELQPWKMKVNQKQAEIDVKASERDMLVKKAEAIRQASAEAQEALEKLRSDQKAKIGEIENLKHREQSLQQELKTAQQRVQDLTVRVSQLRAQASSTRQRVEEAKASQAVTTSQNKVLDSLTRLRNSGRVSGFHGRLGSLGTIPDKFDVAITTACASLNNMVVDTVQQGQTCIEYLRKQNVGRANFLVLEKIDETSGMRPIQTPENVPRLFDLVKPKESRFAHAFYKALRDTLVAQDLAQANRIAFGARRWRVVTLAGELIDSSGTMSGGGAKPKGGGMSSKLAADAVQPEVLRKYEQDCESAAAQLAEATDELRAAEMGLEALARSGPQINLEIDKVNLDIQNAKKLVTEAEKRVRDLTAQNKPNAGDVSRIALLEREIATVESELESLLSRSGTIEEAIKALEKKILDIGGSRLLAQKSKVDGLKLHISLANDEITKAEVAKAKAEKDTVKFENTIAGNQQGLMEVEVELESLNESLQEVKDYVADIRAKVEAAQAEVENSKDDLENLKVELDQKTEEVQAFRAIEVELTQRLTDKKTELKENRTTMDRSQAEHDKLRLEDVDDDEGDGNGNGEGDGDEEPQENNVDGEDETEHSGHISSTKHRKGENDTDPVVKTEEGNECIPSKQASQRHKTSSNELHIYSAAELSRLNQRELLADVQLLDEQLKRSRPNMAVLKEYQRREEEFLRRAKDLDETTALRDAEKQKYDSLRKQRLDEFMAGFSAISLKLKEMYQMITLGGNAELELVDSMDPFSEGIIFSVMPPKKSWRNISNLSGGEKTLSSLALVFALHVYKPTPLYFMDEIDAALDFRNVSIVANYIKDRTKNAQFIIISLRNDMFELSHRLIGIYKTSNQTRSISIDNRSLHVPPPMSTVIQ
ncbi:RecF/RecN/SMC N terminal domain-containing protein [Russula earlei]|uniref:RecF/RecN/SMC N terminal domain-containing protein n=1 Tax=Russula earlei TaxID=71964 RepID=A0ACC0UKN4_9AGAM|nr:RecF/RecN/SMC N terminal domain-containing protein [Russula earlei]